MVLYVVNTPIIALSDEINEINVRVKRIDINEAKKLIRECNFISAVGHASTAEFMSKLLETEIPTNRIYVKYKPNDKAICLKLLRRLEEGKVLSEEELKEIPFELYYLEFF